MATLPKAPTTDFTSTTLNGAIDSSVETITVNSATAIQTPTFAVIDREDGNGIATANLREVVYISSKSGNDLTVTRGVNNSTARSHNSGALLEPMLTVGQWTDLYSVITAAHDTTGGIVTSSTATIAYVEGKSLALTSTASINFLQAKTLLGASGASVIGLTFPSGASGHTLQLVDDTGAPYWKPSSSTGVAADPIWDAAGDLAVGTGANTAARLALGAAETHLVSNGTTAAWSAALFKTGYFTRDLNGSNGNVATTGVGFKPKMIVFLANVPNLANRNSYGAYDGTAYATLMYFTATSTSVSTTEVIYFGDGSSWSATATVASLDADGFTLTWAKSGTPSGTANIIYLAFR